MQTNNKLREALESVKELARTIYSTSDKGSSHEDLAEKIVKLASAALAEPVKNCEVGTVGQQDERFSAFCNRYFNEVGLCDKACPCRDFNMIGGACSIVWTQMPYEEGGDDGQ